MSQKEINQLSYGIVGCAIEVHKHLGPGLLESIYEECMIHELRSKGFDVKNQVLVPVIYKGLEIRQSLRLDILINRVVVV
ncbi:MAG: GxxExxY protein [Saprospiraceae bacterium]|nr:GxxExxY protein [Saprospiraceae bacterium]